MSEDGENCFYPTYLAPKKQGIAIKECMEPTTKFNTYPATIRAWFVTYEEAKRKLERAVEKTYLESDADRGKANRGFRKRKHFEDLSPSKDESDENPTKVRKSLPALQKINSLVLPTFTFLPGETISVSTESHSINTQTKENSSLDFDSNRNDITKSRKSSTVSKAPRSASKTMTASSSRPSLSVTQPGSSNSKKKFNQVSRQSLNVFQPSSSNSKKELNQGSRPSLDVSKSSISTKTRQSSQVKDRSDKATTGKSQRPVLGIADTDDKLENSNLLASSLLGSVESPSNSISSALPTNKRDGNNIHTDFKDMDPRASSYPQGHDLVSDIFCKDNDEDSENSYEPHSNNDSISYKTLDFVDEISQSPAIDLMNLNEQQIDTLDEAADKTAVNKSMPTKQIDRLSSIQVMRLQYDKICRLEKICTKQQTTIEEIHQLLLNRIEVPHHPEGLPSLPFATFEDAKTAEDLINGNPSMKDYVVRKLMFASSGKCEKDCSKKVMALLMTNHTGTFFNWKGGNGKQPFGSWHLKETVITAVKKLRGDKLDTGNAENGVKEWLKERSFRKTNSGA